MHRFEVKKCQTFNPPDPPSAEGGPQTPPGLDIFKLDIIPPVVSIYVSTALHLAYSQSNWLRSTGESKSLPHQLVKQTNSSLDFKVNQRCKIPNSDKFYIN